MEWIQNFLDLPSLTDVLADPASAMSGRSTLVTAAAVVITAYSLKGAWGDVPDWAKPAKFRSKDADKVKRRGSVEDANDDLTTPTAIIAKLQEMMSIVAKECDDVTPDDLPWYKLIACFVTLVHMREEHRINHPKKREAWFQPNKDAKESDTGDATKEEMKELSGLLDFAEWAYEENFMVLRDNLATKGYKLLRQDLITEPGRVGHYIALDQKNRVALLGLKGTSTVYDMLTDLLGKSVEHKLEGPFDDEHKDDIINCHEGIYTASTVLADDTQYIIEDLLLPQGYKLLICGHSLGAGASCLLGLLLRSRIPALRKDGMVRVVAYATPPVLNHDACLACRSFATSIVNDTDIVPRATTYNVVILNKLLLKINEKLTQKGMSPDGILSAYKLAKDLSGYDDDCLMTPDELDAFFEETHKEDIADEDNLFVPGRVVALYEKGVVAATKSRVLENGEEDLDIKTKPREAYGATVSHGGLRAMRCIEPRLEMMTDHMTSGYREAIDSVCQG